MFLFYYTAIDEMETFYETDRKNGYMSTANVIAGYVTSSEQLTDEIQKASLDYEINDKSKEGGYRVLIQNTSGIVISDTNQMSNGKLYIVPESMSALSGIDAVGLRDDEHSVYASSTLLDEDNEVVGAVLVVGDVSDIYVLIDELKQNLFIYSLFFAVFVLGLVTFFTNLFLSPFKKILKVLEEMADGHLDKRISIKRRDEIGEIADSINDMAHKLEQVEVTRDQFVSNVSHELKTPLSSIKVLSESILLQDEVPVSMYVEFLQDINSEVDRMASIVNDLLALVKLDQREVKLNTKLFRIDILVLEICKRLTPLANFKGLKLKVAVEKEILITADEVKLTLALSNIIENAIKYTEEGHIDVIVTCDHQNAFITVADTGIGIGEEEQSKIFGRFYRVDKVRDRETGGTGLGLSITQSTILLHKGSIRVSSLEGEGATFTVRLPMN